MENRSLVTIAEHSKEKILYLLEMAKEFEKKPNRKLLDNKVVEHDSVLKQQPTAWEHGLSDSPTPKLPVLQKAKH